VQGLADAMPKDAKKGRFGKTVLQQNLQQQKRPPRKKQPAKKK
jgi:DNA topoisomerase-1